MTGTDPLTLGPAVAKEAGSQSYIIQIYSGLLKIGSSLVGLSYDANKAKVLMDCRLSPSARFLDILFHSGSDYNYCNYSKPQVDAIIQQAEQASDQARSFSLYQQA